MIIASEITFKLHFVALQTTFMIWKHWRKLKGYDVACYSSENMNHRKKFC